MPTYNVAPHYVPADNDVEANDAYDAVTQEIESAVELMQDRDNWIVTEVHDDDA